MKYISFHRDCRCRCLACKPYSSDPTAYFYLQYKIHTDRQTTTDDGEANSACTTLHKPYHKIVCVLVTDNPFNILID